MNYRLGILIDENNASNNKSICVDTRFKSSKFVTYFNTDILFFYNKTYKSLYIAKRFGNSSDYKVIKSVEIYSNPEDVNKDVYYMEFCQDNTFIHFFALFYDKIYYFKTEKESLKVDDFVNSVEKLISYTTSQTLESLKLNNGDYCVKSNVVNSKHFDERLIKGNNYYAIFNLDKNVYNGSTNQLEDIGTSKQRFHFANTLKDGETSDNWPMLLYEDDVFKLGKMNFNTKKPFDLKFMFLNDFFTNKETNTLKNNYILEINDNIIKVKFDPGDRLGDINVYTLNSNDFTNVKIDRVHNTDFGLYFGGDNTSDRLFFSAKSLKPTLRKGIKPAFFIGTMSEANLLEEIKGLNSGAFYIINNKDDKMADRYNLYMDRLIDGKYLDTLLRNYNDGDSLPETDRMFHTRKFSEKYFSIIEDLRFISLLLTTVPEYKFQTYSWFSQNLNIPINIDKNIRYRMSKYDKIYRDCVDPYRYFAGIYPVHYVYLSDIVHKGSDSFIKTLFDNIFYGNIGKYDTETMCSSIFNNLLLDEIRIDKNIKNDAGIYSQKIESFVHNAISSDIINEKNKYLKYGNIIDKKFIDRMILDYYNENNQDFLTDVKDKLDYHEQYKIGGKTLLQYDKSNTMGYMNKGFYSPTLNELFNDSIPY